MSAGYLLQSRVFQGDKKRKHYLLLTESTPNIRGNMPHNYAHDIKYLHLHNIHLTPGED